MGGTVADRLGLRYVQAKELAMAQNVRKGHEVARWSEEQEKWVVEMFFTDKVPSISKAKKANGLGARCWRDGEEWPPASLKKAV